MRSTGSWLCSAAILLLAAISGTVGASTFHAVIVGDTNDSEIGASVATDVGVARRFAEALAEHYGQARITVITGREASPARFRSALDGLAPAANDFVFVYYSGHGNTGRAPSPWPKLSFGGGNLEGSAVLSAISAKTPARFLTVFDACNGSERLPERRRPATANFQRSQVDRLFKSLRGSVVVTSSEAPYVSYADSQGRGSVFSYAFFEVMGDVLTSPVERASWSQLLARAADRTNAIATRGQRPKFEVSGE